MQTEFISVRLLKLIRTMDECDEELKKGELLLPGYEKTQRLKLIRCLAHEEYLALLHNYGFMIGISPEIKVLISDLSRLHVPLKK